MTHVPWFLKICIKQIRSFVHAGNGIRLFILSERHAKIHVAIALAVMAWAIIAGFSATDCLLSLSAIFLVLICEMINTSIESCVDLVSTQAHPLAKKAKDIAAGAVLLAAVYACLTGLYLLNKHYL